MGSPAAGSTPDDLVLRSWRVVLPEGERPATVRVAGGRITAVEPYHGGGGTDLEDAVLLPGLVDTHVHVNQPGRTDWEGFDTATRAAAAGGVTTILDMPLNCLPPTVDVAALDAKRAAARGRCHVDVGFWGGAVPGNLGELPGLLRAGVFGFKCFLVDSGVSEFPPLDPAGLAAALGAVDALFAVHAEDPATIRPAPATRRYAEWLDSRPPESEQAAVRTVVATAAAAAARVHVLHVSSAGAAALVAAARRDGVRISAETCPHYLALAAEQVRDGATDHKCCPPVREAANRERLWDALAAGALDCVVSDHSPCPPALKHPETGDFAAAWGGIASLQLGLPVVWTRARERGHTLVEVVRWMAQRPAAIAGLAGKGRIAVGYDADLVAFAPKEEFTVEPGRLHHRHPVTPYAGQRLSGVVRRTWLRGEPVTGEAPRGQLLTRGDS